MFSSEFSGKVRLEISIPRLTAPLSPPPSFFGRDFRRKYPKIYLMDKRKLRSGNVRQSDPNPNPRKRLQSESESESEKAAQSDPNPNPSRIGSESDSDSRIRRPALICTHLIWQIDIFTMCARLNYLYMPATLWHQFVPEMVCQQYDHTILTVICDRTGPGASWQGG